VATETTGDLGQAQVQQRRDEAAEKGHFGEKPPGPANEEYSLRTGPKSPSALEATIMASEQQLKALKESGGDA
jgi:hypothetical protein